MTPAHNGSSATSVENLRSTIFGTLAALDRLELYRYAIRIGAIEESWAAARIADPAAWYSSDVFPAIACQDI